MTKLTELQRKAVASIDKHVLVSAGAGSGKTMVLVERIIEALRSSTGTKISQVIAVTYTRKAAAEMHTRLKRELQKLALDAQQADRHRWSEHLAEIDTAKIGTIHSLCESILKSFAFAANLEPEFEQLDDISRSELQDMVAKEALQLVISEQAEEHELLLLYPWELLNDWLNLVLSYPLRYREATREYENLDEERFAAHLAKLLRTVQLRKLKKFQKEPLLKEIHQALQDASDTDGITKLGDFRRETLGRLRELQRDSDISESALADRWRVLRDVSQDSLGRQGNHKEETKRLKEHLKAIRELAKDYCGDEKKGSLIPAEIEQADLRVWHSTKLLMFLAHRALGIYEERKLTTGIDYDDLIAKVSSALNEEGSPIREHYHRSVAHILVDEFQDTNFTQANLIETLAGPEAKLFLIGDDKQSIYKFQGTEVAHFTKRRNDFLLAEKAPIDEDKPTHLLVELKESFRSHPKIVHFFNAIFEKLFFGDTALAPYYADYRALIPKVEADDGDASERVEIIRCSGDDVLPPEELEANAVADWIREKVSSKVKIREQDGTFRALEHGDIAILVQANDMLAGIEKGLTKHKIPYVRLGGQGFLDRQEVYDVQNLLDFVHNPGNSHALIGLLRAPFCALPDDLIHILFAGKTEPLWKVLEKAAKENHEGYELVSRAYSLFRRTLADSNILTLPQLLCSFIQTTNYDLALMEMQNGRQRSRNLWKLVDMAGHHQDMTCGQFSNRLKNMRKLAVKEKDAPVDTENSVKLMTIHAAKGLEFPAVILPRLTGSGRSNRGKFLFHKDYALAFDDTRFPDEQKPLHYRLAGWLEQDMEEAEKQRLLYVAMTRARDYLAMFLPGGRNGKSKKSFASWLNEIIFHPDENLDQVTDNMPVTLHMPRSASTFLFRRMGSVVQEKTVPGFVNASRERQRAQSEANIEMQSATAISRQAVDYALIEPMHSELRDLPNNALVTLRVSPGDNSLSIGPILLGNYFHALLERLSHEQKDCDELFLRNVALLQGRAVAHKNILAQLMTEGRRLLKIYFDSELFDMIRTAITRHHELPYSLVLEDRLETKRPDLLIQKADHTWHVIDYKTDSFSWIDVERQAATHQKQLQDYARDLSRLIGQSVAPHLYFAQHGRIFLIEAKY